MGEIDVKQVNESGDDKLFVLGVAVKLFKKTFPFDRDEVGYTFPDAWLFKSILADRDYSELTNDNVEWVRRSLLKYEKQIRELGFDYDRINRIKMSERAIFYKTISPEAKIINLSISIKRETRITAKYRIYKQREREIVSAIFSRDEGLAMLEDSCPKCGSDKIGMKESTCEGCEYRDEAGGCKYRDEAGNKCKAEIHIIFERERSKELAEKWLGIKR